MKKIKVSELKPGMAFDQPVYIDPTNVLVQAKQILNARDIERLVKWGIREVETNGKILVPEEPKPAAQKGRTESNEIPPPIHDIPEEERIRLQTSYEAMRKNKLPFRTLVKETAETLRANFQALVEGKPFDNHLVLNIASRLTDEIVAREYILLSLCGAPPPANWYVYHSVHAACYGIILGHSLNFNRPRLVDLMFSMLLMDCGMARVPLHVKDKDTDLNNPEWTSIKKHTLLGYQLLTKNAKVKATLAAACLQHHEFFDGSGYPQGLKGSQIDETARIASIADSYTAMIEPRNHREALLPYEAMKNMLSVQMNKFDPRLLRTFLGHLSIYPLGSLVQLSNGSLALVIGCNSEKPLRPLLRLMRDDKGLPFNGLSFLDLNYEPTVYIVKAIKPENSGVDMDTEI